MKFALLIFTLSASFHSVFADDAYTINLLKPRSNDIIHTDGFVVRAEIKAPLAKTVISNILIDGTAVSSLHVEPSGVGIYVAEGIATIVRSRDSEYASVVIRAKITRRDGSEEIIESKKYEMRLHKNNWAIDGGDPFNSRQFFHDSVSSLEYAWSAVIAGDVNIAPVGAGTNLVIGSESPQGFNLQCIDVRTGGRKWQIGNRELGLLWDFGLLIR